MTAGPSEEDVTAALAVVARKVLADVTVAAAPKLGRSYPDLAEHDWMRALAMVLKATPAPEPWQYADAVALLAARPAAEVVAA